MRSVRVRVLAAIAVFLAAVLLVFPTVLGPSVTDPAPSFPDNPFSTTVRIANQNFTPLTNLEFSCELEGLTLASGAPIPDAKILNTVRVRRLPSRRAVTTRCETAFVIDAPVKAAEFKLTVQYRASPWPQVRTKAYLFDAVLDAQGRVTKWSRK